MSAKPFSLAWVNARPALATSAVHMPTLLVHKRELERQLLYGNGALDFSPGARWLVDDPSSVQMLAG